MIIIIIEAIVSNQVSSKQGILRQCFLAAGGMVRRWRQRQNCTTKIYEVDL